METAFRENFFVRFDQCLQGCDEKNGLFFSGGTFGELRTVFASGLQTRCVRGGGSARQRVSALQASRHARAYARGLLITFSWVVSPMPVLALGRGKSAADADRAKFHFFKIVIE